MLLEVENITKSFGEKRVLEGVGFNSESGSATGILGRNGAGKTTAIRIIMGVFGCESGRVTLDGVPLNRNKLNIGYLPEERGLYPKKPIIDQLIYFGMLRGMRRRDAGESARKWLARLDMSEYLHKKLDVLSKGNQQKIQLAQTLLTNPDIVILDEPFSGLDPVNAMLLKDVVKELIADGKIVLFSSHQMNYIEEFCNNIVILHGGKTVLSGNIREIKRRYDRDKLIISSPDTEKVTAFCRDKLGAIAAKTENFGEDVIVTLNSAADKNKFITTLVGGNDGIEIDGISVYEPTLNDIFVEYTGGKD